MARVLKTVELVICKKAKARNIRVISVNFAFRIATGSHYFVRKVKNSESFECW